MVYLFFLINPYKFILSSLIAINAQMNTLCILWYKCYWMFEQQLNMTNIWNTINPR